MLAGRKATIALLALALGCGDSGGSSSPAGPAADAGPETPWPTALADADCPAGTRPSVGVATCVPVGVPACPDGFAPDPSGWGCLDVQPAARCDGATREVLGKTTCMPIGDCDAAFPPPGTTHIVDASLGAEDATHFKTISAAVKAATSGAIIAVERGSYVENVAVRASITIQGRCARDVLVTSPDGTGAGVEAGAKDVVVRGLTLKGHRGGVVTVLKGTVTIEDVLVDHAKIAGLVASTGAMTVRRTRIVDAQPLADGSGGVGILAQHGSVTGTEISVVGATSGGAGGGAPDAAIHLERSIIRDIASSPAGDGGAGISMAGGAPLELVDSAIASVHASGVEIFDGGKATITRSVIRGVAANGKGVHGDAIAASKGTVVTATGVTISDAAEVGAAVLGGDLTLSDSTIRGPGRGAAAQGGGKLTLSSVAIVSVSEVGALAQDTGSVAHLERSLVRDVATSTASPDIGEGVGATFGGAVELVDSAIVRAAQVALAVGGVPSAGPASRASLDHVAIVDPRLSSIGFGRGIECAAASDVTITDSIVTGSPETGIVAGDDSTVRVARTLVAKTAGATYQHGIVGVDRATLTVSSSLVQGSAGAGIAFARATGALDDVLLQGNTLGLAVLESTVKEVEALPDALDTGTVYVRATRFDGNGTRFSADQLPLPSVRGF